MGSKTVHSRLQENHFDIAERRWPARVAQQESTPAGCSKSSSSKDAASEGPEAYPLGYVEDLNDARTMLADFFSILLRATIGRRNSLFEDRAEAEVGDGIFEVGI
jgi:hypothetical protein